MVAHAPSHFHTFDDLETNLRRQIAKVRAHPWVPKANLGARLYLRRRHRSVERDHRGHPVMRAKKPTSVSTGFDWPLKIEALQAAQEEMGMVIERLARREAHLR